MKRDRNPWVILWLVVLTVGCAVSLMRSFRFSAPLTADYAALLVGVLASLCTVLIGWQIFTLIDLRQVRKLNQQLKDEVDRHLHEVSIVLHSQMAAAFKGIIQASDNDLRKTEYLVLTNYLDWLIHKLRIDKLDGVDDGIRLMFRDLIARQPLRLNPMEFNRIEEQVDELRILFREKRLQPVVPLREIFRFIQAI